MHAKWIATIAGVTLALSASGAFADHTTIQRAKQAGLDIHRHLTNNDAYPFFKSLGDLLITGPTGTNVMDLNIILVRQP